VNQGFTIGIAGMPEGEGRALLAELFSDSVRPAHIYRHRWQAGDLVAWDNRCTMHHATEYDVHYVPAIQRTTVRGDRPV